jgi:glycosyltransferase involved in cell wall biosynthesis
MSVTVLTASIPSRSAMLAECVASVAAQTTLPAVHLVGIDVLRAGTSAVRNALLGAVRTPWVAVLDDDDVALPNHLAALLAASDQADVVYSLPSIEGRSGWQPVADFDPDRLRRESYIPCTALVRTRLLDVLGGWRDSADCLNGWEDWDLWLRALNADARFVHVPEVTWRYRFHDGNKTHHGEAGAR